MDIELNRLSFPDRIERFLLDGKKTWKDRSKKLTKDEMSLDIVLWNIVKQSDIKITETYGDIEAKIGNKITVVFGYRHEKLIAVKIDETKVSVISRATALLIMRLYKEEKMRLEEEKKFETTNKLKQKLYEGFIENKGL